MSRAAKGRSLLNPGRSSSSRISPKHVQSWQRGFQSQGVDEAVAAYSSAIRLKPGYADAYEAILARQLRNLGKFDEAAAACAAAIKLRPDMAEPHSNLGNALAAPGKVRGSASAAYSRAIQLEATISPSVLQPWAGGSDPGKLDEAIAAYSRAIELKPDFSDAHNNLGNAAPGKACLMPALESYARAMALRPDDAGFHSNRIFCILYHPAYDSAAILGEEIAWNNAYSKPRIEARFGNDVRPSNTAGTTPPAAEDRIHYAFRSRCRRAKYSPVVSRARSSAVRDLLL